MSTAGKVLDTDRGYKAAIAAFQVLAKGGHVVVGVRGERGAIRERREGAPGSRVAVPDSTALTLVEIAAVHEFGSDAANIPERSFLRATFDAKVGEYAQALTGGVERILDGKSTVDTELELLGLRAVGDVQSRIADGIEPAISKATAARKGSTKPLIDTGRLRQSIDSEVRR